MLLRSVPVVPVLSSLLVFFRSFLCLTMAELRSKLAGSFRSSEMSGSEVPQLCSRMAQLFCVAILLVSGIPLQAQSEPNLDTGFKPYGAFDGSNIESIDLSNGNLIVHIPMLFHYPQRGSLNPRWVLTANSMQWGVHCFTPPNSSQNCSWGLPAGITALVASLGNGVGLDYSLDLAVHRTRQISSQQGASDEAVYNYYLNTADGARHPFHDTAGQSVLDAADTSGWRLVLSGSGDYGNPTTGVLTDRHGNVYALSN